MADVKSTYICAHCKGEFELVLEADEKAHAEAKELWGKDGHAPGMDVICDDCYRKFMEWFEGDES